MTTEKIFVRAGQVKKIAEHLGGTNGHSARVTEKEKNENYFISGGTHWRSRVGGGEEALIKNNKRIKTLTYFLENPHQKLDRKELL